jgi:hypothetical protein
MLEEALAAGAGRCCIARNVWLSQSPRSLAPGWWDRAGRPVLEAADAAMAAAQAADDEAGD